MSDTCAMLQRAQRLQIIATWARPEPLQVSHLLSPTLPLAHFGQIHATAVLVVFLQKSHHLSPARPSAHLSQMNDSWTWWEKARQKLQWCAPIEVALALSVAGSVARSTAPAWRRPGPELASAGSPSVGGSALSSGRAGASRSRRAGRRR